MEPGGAALAGSVYPYPEVKGAAWPSGERLAGLRPERAGDSSRRGRPGLSGPKSLGGLIPPGVCWQITVGSDLAITPAGVLKRAGGGVMSRKKVLVLGGNFAGLTAALAVRHELHGDVDVRVVSASDRFLFNPSLIWLPFGKRHPADITFPLAPTFEAHGIDFVHAEATALDLDGGKVTTTGGVYDYDYLVIATGYRNNFGVVPGLGPGGNAYTITTLDDAIKAGEGWRRFLENPGDIVVGASQGAGCFGAAYEYLFNVSYRLRKAGLKSRVKLTYVSAEPFLGHFGIGGDMPAVCVMDTGNNGVIILADKMLPPRKHGVLIPGPQ